MKKCQTPGAYYNFWIGENQVSIDVCNIPGLDLTEKQAIELENELHDALEAVLKQFWKSA